MWTKFDYQNPPKDGYYWLAITSTNDSKEYPRLGQAYQATTTYEGLDDLKPYAGFAKVNHEYPPPTQSERVTHYLPILPPELPKEGEESLSAQSLSELAIIQAFQRGKADGAAEERARLLAPFFEIGKLLSDMKEG